MDRLQVLDKGYVRLVETMGTDLTIVNSARVSFDKQKHEMDSKDERLIDFLIREGHTSPLRHASMQFEIYAPLMVARQWWKYVVGSDHTMDAWNESSRRYISEDEQFYLPSSFDWRSKPENSKQGSGDKLSPSIGLGLSRDLKDFIQLGEKLYKGALDQGVAPEQARLFLPAYGMYVRWYWTASLQSVLHFLDQRLGHDAQAEIQDYAVAVDAYTKTKFPAVHKAWQELRK